ncbi:UNVERIFIED_CONTAM: hypothetical protein B566_EDAN018665 [Ephemera danica]|nr:hypothetical protein B566_EDAN018665 [Ephemera danica]
MTHPNHQTNGASLEDCHTNFFALWLRSYTRCWRSNDASKSSNKRGKFGGLPHKLLCPVVVLSRIEQTAVHYFVRYTLGLERDTRSRQTSLLVSARVDPNTCVAGGMHGVCCPSWGWLLAIMTHEPSVTHTDLCGIKWRKLLYTESSYLADPLDDPVLASFSKCLAADILCVWRRVQAPRPPPISAPPTSANAFLSALDPMQAALGGGYHRQAPPPQLLPPPPPPPPEPALSLHSNKELWIF